MGHVSFVKMIYGGAFMFLFCLVRSYRYYARRQSICKATVFVCGSNQENTTQYYNHRRSTSDNIQNVEKTWTWVPRGLAHGSMKKTVDITGEEKSVRKRWSFDICAREYTCHEGSLMQRPARRTPLPTSPLTAHPHSTPSKFQPKITINNHNPLC